MAKKKEKTREIKNLRTFILVTPDGQHEILAESDIEGRMQARELLGLTGSSCCHKAGYDFYEVIS